MPERIYMNRIPGEERIHIEFPAHEVADILDDFTPADDAYDATKQLRLVLEKAAAELNLTYTNANMPPQRPHETGQTAPHGPHGPADAPMGPATSERIGDGCTAVRVFWLQRDHDVSGVSGTGTVSDGVEWPDGTVTIRWRGPRPSTVNWASLDDAMAIHGHGGATRIVWAPLPDTAPDSPECTACGCTGACNGGPCPLLPTRPAAEQPAPTTYAEAQQQHIQLLRRRLAARQALDDAWDRLEEQAIHHLVRLASTDDSALEARP